MTTTTDTKSGERFDADLIVQYGGRWMTYAEFERARLDKIMPPQPKRDWRRK